MARERRVALLWTIGLGLATVATGIACGRSERPVASPAATTNRQRAPLGSPLDVTYRFQVAPDARIDGDYRVLVHFVDADDELMWTDDHDPPTPTSQWKPGQVIEYTRTLFIPVYPYLGQATIQMGLYDPRSGRRLRLSGRDTGQKAYTVASIELQPQSEALFLVYGDGWHEQEISPSNALEEWRWTKQAARVSFRNPQRDVVIYLDADGRTDVFDAPPQVSLRVGDQVVDTFALKDNSRFLRRTRVGAATLGTGEMVDMILAVDRTFVPAAHGGNDRRELGLRVYHLFVEVQ
jgi:hypothetical protein